MYIIKSRGSQSSTCAALVTAVYSDIIKNRMELLFCLVLHLHVGWQGVVLLSCRTDVMQWLILNKKHQKTVYVFDSSCWLRTRVGTSCYTGEIRISKHVSKSTAPSGPGPAAGRSCSIWLQWEQSEWSRYQLDLLLTCRCSYSRSCHPVQRPKLYELPKEEWRLWLHPVLIAEMQAQLLFFWWQLPLHFLDLLQAILDRMGFFLQDYLCRFCDSPRSGRLAICLCLTPQDHLESVLEHIIAGFPTGTLEWHHLGRTIWLSIPEDKQCTDSQVLSPSQYPCSEDIPWWWPPNGHPSTMDHHPNYTDPFRDQLLWMLFLIPRRLLRCRGRSVGSAGDPVQWLSSHGGQSSGLLCQPRSVLW